VIETLTWVAARTERVRLFTGVVVALFQPAVVLARRVATLDQLSGGRVDLGIAAGWLPEEFAAVGAPQDDRGARFEEHLAALRACWGPDPVELRGRWTTIPPSRIGPKPVGHVPLIVGGVAPSATERAARMGDGLIIGARDWDSTLAQIDVYRQAGGTGRVVMRAGPMLADAQHATPPTAWTPPHVLDDLARAHAAGVDEVIWDLNIVGTPIPEQLAELERLAAALELERGS
jgi:alkanesulfonate monooxygenase SsuD/methylene tetrahydromethanopterin reductase-like flavin-dependent oxidoreductase (luciferase family)